MNSFERFDAILRHEKPDKLPFYFPTIACTVASEILGREIDSGADSLHYKEEASWLDGEGAHEEFACRYMENAIELNRKLGADIVRETWRSRSKPTKRLDENTLLFGKEDGPHIIKRFFPEQQSYGVVEDTASPRDSDELAAILKREMVQEIHVTDDQLSSIYHEQMLLKKMADPYFPTIFGGPPAIGIPMTSVAWLEATVLEPELLSEYFMCKAEIAVQHIRWLSKQGIRFINAGADLASNSGPVYSPESFRSILVRPLRLVAEECARYNMVYRFRTDGNIWSLMDYMFKETGVQAYGEVDREATMTVGRIREKCPELIILGNISSATLCKGTEDDVREETRASLMESGGRNYIPGPSNAVVHGTPAGNVYAMVEEINKYRP
jgi:hypothetical protein